MSREEIVRQQRGGSERKSQQRREGTTRQQQQQRGRKSSSATGTRKGRTGHRGTSFSTFDPTAHSTPSVRQAPRSSLATPSLAPEARTSRQRYSNTTATHTTGPATTTEARRSALDDGHVTGREYCSYLVTGNLWPYTDNKFCEYGCCEKDCCTYNDYLATSKRKTWTLIGAAVGVVVMLMVLTTAACCVYRRRHPRIVTQGFSGNMDNAIPGSCADTGGGACYNSLTMDALMAACLLMATAGKLGVVMLATGWAGGQAAVCLCDGHFPPMALLAFHGVRVVRSLGVRVMSSLGVRVMSSLSVASTAQWMWSGLLGPDEMFTVLCHLCVNPAQIILIHPPQPGVVVAGGSGAWRGPHGVGDQLGRRLLLQETPPADGAHPVWPLCGVGVNHHSISVNIIKQNLNLVTTTIQPDPQSQRGMKT
ncbi:hypothetical protein C0Q70_14606 [Pomacea canaliculata]|uniref:Uncharacterized protein n=1 Tax=Pomacea canaliculata TaxID=400727 RepID=A0A2T7NSK8_POMCA|nr:hypothetical protein C0Q70_14606 [Pomacea canaliculata]